MIERTRFYPLQGIVRQVELAQIRRVVEEACVELTDTARIQIEIEQRTAIQEVSLDHVQRVVLELECD